MEPLPETRKVLDELDPHHDGLLEQLMASARRVHALVPDCVGISLAHVRERLVFTLTATDTEIAVLDAVQYLAGGPCVDAVRAERVLEEELEEPLAEHAWQLFAQSSAATAVRSTLTLPILSGGEVVGSVNLYGGAGS